MQKAGHAMASGDGICDHKVTYKVGPPYDQINDLDRLPSKFLLVDNIGGFDENLSNHLFNRLQSYAEENNKSFSIGYQEILQEHVKKKYNRLGLTFDFTQPYRWVWRPIGEYREHPSLTFENFLCSFNGSPHVSRKLLVSILHRFGWYDTNQISKNFVFGIDELDGHLANYVDIERTRVLRKFFLGADSEMFFQSTNSFGHQRIIHANNIRNLEHILTRNFLHLVSETMATSYHPFVTEKFLYSVVTRGLFVAYAQPAWHAHLQRYYGFKKYDKIFDYKFDSIQNPVERLVELMSMLAKFSMLSTDDWRDLYLVERDTIDYNYDHFFSRRYMINLASYHTQI